MFAGIDISSVRVYFCTGFLRVLIYIFLPLLRNTCGVVVVVVVVVLTLTGVVKSVVTGQALVTLAWRNTLRQKTQLKPKVVYAYMLRN